MGDLTAAEKETLWMVGALWDLEQIGAIVSPINLTPKGVHGYDQAHAEGHIPNDGKIASFVRVLVGENRLKKEEALDLRKLLTAFAHDKDRVIRDMEKIKKQYPDDKG